MKILLDTHVILFIYSEENRISSNARRALDDAANELIVSAISIYEIVRKHMIGKLPQAGRFISDWQAILARDGFTLIDLRPDEAACAAAFPSTHRDPFDRMLAAQALVNGLFLLSADTALDGFGVERLW
ncbi:type II toxin-antitoxin system VapC family toxin [Mongoliimonas terrestris]|uniref:type II toxin-antitoxin system VapC family toxin n=1 Tax=Mongoliimonas terrestris TaxID=1709001 RepID=UPI000949766E|nr:type II toxin-antitoxin system VapC family toxin [Mongoliimonas terrestris]